MKDTLRFIVCMGILMWTVGVGLLVYQFTLSGTQLAPAIILLLFGGGLTIALALCTKEGEMRP